MSEVTTNQVAELIAQLAAMTAAASITPQTVAAILEKMRNLNDQEREKVIAVAEAKIAEIQDIGIAADHVTLDSGVTVEEEMQKKAYMVELYQRSTSLPLPVDATYFYKGLPTHSVVGTAYDSANEIYTEYIGICINHEDDGGFEPQHHDVLVFVKNGSNYIYSETFNTSEASGYLEVHIARAFGSVNATPSSSGLMSATDKVHLDRTPDTGDEAGSDLDFADEDGNVIMRCKDGEVETKKFNSAKTPRQEDSDSEFDISDEQGNVAMEIKNGHMRTKKFNSRTATSVKQDGTASNVFNITDENGNIIVQFKGGHVKTSKFDSSKINTNPSSDIIDGYTTIKSGMRLLFIGNSWSRDTVRLLWQTAKDAGVKDLIVCQAYLGGASLYHQYIGMDDPTATYQHGSNTNQYIQGSYQLWTYKEGSNGELSLVKKPTNYNNGRCGTFDGTAWGKNQDGSWAACTLSSILKMYEWDIISITFQGYDLLLEDDWATNDPTLQYVDILTFIDRIKQELSDDCLDKVEFGITSSWGFADGVHRDMSTKALRYCDLTQSQWDALSQSQKNDWYHQMYEDGQKNFQRIAKRMGNLCTYIVNTAKAIEYARKTVIVGDVGFGLHKSATDTHLAEGIPKYICACLLCYEELGVKPQDFMDDYVAGGNPDADTDGGSESTNPTRAQCVAAQKIAWAAYCDNYVVLN
jgi:hypothetical protein